MDNLTEQLTQILNDPGSMKQIMELASALGAVPEGDLPQALPEQLAAALKQAGSHDPKQDALVHALMPYLRPGRRERLEQALRIARISRLAGSALLRGASFTGEGESHV